MARKSNSIQSELNAKLPFKSGQQDDESRRSSVRRNAQAVLLYLAEECSSGNQRFYTGDIPQRPAVTSKAFGPSIRYRSHQSWQSGYVNIIPVISENVGTTSADTDFALSKLVSRTQNVNKFLTFELTSAQQALLVPKIRLYKVDYKIYRPPHPEAGSIDRDATPTIRPILFNEAVSGDELSAMLESRGGNIGTSGIENFSWDLMGVNPAEVDANIEARLKIYFNNVNVFQSLLDGTMNSTSKTVGSFMDLITFAPPQSVFRIEDLPCLEEYDPAYFEILAEVGWDVSDTIPDNILTDDQKDAIRDQTVSLYLTLTDHKFDFRQDGSATLEVNYRARTTMNSRQFDVLNPPPAVEASYQNVKNKEEQIEQLAEAGHDPLKSDMKVLEQRQEAYREVVDENYKRIISSVLRNVYEVEVSNRLLLNGIRAADPDAPGTRSGTLTYPELFELLASSYDEPTSMRLGIDGRPVEGTKRFDQVQLQRIRTAYSNAKSSLKVKRRTRDMSAEKLMKFTLDTEKDLSTADVANPGWDAGSEEITKEAFYDATGNFSIINFLYLGDILEIFTTTIPIRKEVENRKFAIVTTDFRYKNPLKMLENIKPNSIGRWSQGTAFDYTAGSEKVSLTALKCVEASLSQTIRQSMYSSINLANVPINLELFLDWFSDKVVGTERTNFYLEDFLTSFFNTLVKPALAAGGILGVPGNQPVLTNINIDTNKKECALLNGETEGLGIPTASSFGARKNPVKSEDDEYKLPIGIGNQVKVLPASDEDVVTPKYDTLHGGSRFNFIAPIDNYVQWSKDHGREVIPPRRKGSPLHIQQDDPDMATVKVLGVNMTVDNLRGHYVENSNKGVVNFIAGLDRGIVKEIEFERVDQPYLRESRTSTSKNFGKGQLRELYNVKLRLYGNNILRPGMIIYVEPNSLIFGRPNDQNSVSRALGLGGYYMTVDVKNEISKDGWETTVNALHMAMPYSGASVTSRVVGATATP